MKFDRETMNVSFGNTLDDPFRSGEFSQASTCCYGVFGVVNLFSGPYIIAISDRKLVLTISSKAIYKICDVAFIPCRLKSKNDSQYVLHNLFKCSDEFAYIKMIKNAFKFNDLYFSYEYDLTRRISTQNCLFENAVINWNLVNQTFLANKNWLFPYSSEERSNDV